MRRALCIESGSSTTMLGQRIQELNLFKLEAPTFAARVQGDSLRELADSTADPQETLFMSKCLPMYISAAIEQIRKHDGTFIAQASVGKPVAVRGTNRSVEAGMGKTKNYLKRNPKTRALLLQAKLQVCQFDTDALDRAMHAHSDRFGLRESGTQKLDIQIANLLRRVTSALTLVLLPPLLQQSPRRLPLPPRRQKPRTHERTL